MKWCPCYVIRILPEYRSQKFYCHSRLDAIVERTRTGGGEILNLLKDGLTHVALAVAVAQMTEAILKDQHLIVPASVYLQGEYGLSGFFFGVPAQLDRGGMEKVIEYHLDSEEMVALAESARAAEESLQLMEKLCIE